MMTTVLDVFQRPKQRLASHNLREENYRFKEEAHAGFLTRPLPETCIGNKLLQNPFSLWSDINPFFKRKKLNWSSTWPPYARPDGLAANDGLHEPNFFRLSE